MRRNQQPVEQPEQDISVVVGWEAHLGFGLSNSLDDAMPLHAGFKGIGYSGTSGLEIRAVVTCAQKGTGQRQK
jgi:hypothetical protein